MPAGAHSTIPSLLTTVAPTLLLSIVPKLQAEEVEMEAGEGCHPIPFTPNNGKNALLIAAAQILFMPKIYRELFNSFAILCMQIKFNRFSLELEYQEG